MGQNSDAPLGVKYTGIFLWSVKLIFFMLACFLTDIFSLGDILHLGCLFTIFSEARYIFLSVSQIFSVKPILYAVSWRTHFEFRCYWNGAWEDRRVRLEAGCVYVSHLSVSVCTNASVCDSWLWHTCVLMRIFCVCGLSWTSIGCIRTCHGKNFIRSRLQYFQ